MKDEIDVLLKTMLFWLNHIDQNMVLNPTKSNLLFVLFIFCIHSPYTCLMFREADKPNAICINLQRNLAIAQSKNKCCMISKLLQKQHNIFLCQFLLTKLSWVRIASLYSNHRKTLIFNGALIF
jgi:hypothetical protein